MEARRIEKEMAAAQSSGDISTIINLITSTSKKTVEDFIKETCGGLLFMYYMYLDKFHERPTDLEDLVDGLLYLDAKNYIERDFMERELRDAEKKRGNR